MRSKKIKTFHIGIIKIGVLISLKYPINHFNCVNQLLFTQTLRYEKTIKPSMRKYFRVKTN